MVMTINRRRFLVSALACGRGYRNFSARSIPVGLRRIRQWFFTAENGMWDKDKSGKGYDQFQWRIGMLTPVSAAPD